MKLSLFLLLCLIDVVPVILQIVHDYYMVLTPSTWADAQAYCRVKYVDLATMQSEADWSRLNNEAQNNGLATTGWVGLYIDVKAWYWSYALTAIDPTVTFWGPGQPDNDDGIEECGAIDSNGNWADFSCLELKPIICFYIMTGGFVGVSSTPMTWLEGQTYCKTYYTDLASSKTPTENSQLQQIAASQGTSWFGLFRDPWLWSDYSVNVRMLWAPGHPNNVDHNDDCGAVDNGLLVDRQCNNLLNFFCYGPLHLKYQIVKFQIQGDQSLLDPVVQSAILQLIKQKLKDHSFSRTKHVTWRVHPDGSIFHEKRVSL